MEQQSFSRAVPICSSERQATILPLAYTADVALAAHQQRGRA
jgi:hypothetical protein